MMVQPEMPSLMTTSEMDASGRNSREVDSGIRSGELKVGKGSSSPRVVESCRPRPAMARMDSERPGASARWQKSG